MSLLQRLESAQQTADTRGAGAPECRHRGTRRRLRLT